MLITEPGEVILMRGRTLTAAAAPPCKTIFYEHRAGAHGLMEGYTTYFFECIRPSFGRAVNHPWH